LDAIYELLKNGSAGQDADVTVTIFAFSSTALFLNISSTLSPFYREHSIVHL